MVTDDPRLSRAKRFDWDKLISALQLRSLKRNGVHRTGPCPKCGDFAKTESDRFNINTQMGVFGCRKCGAKGDQAALVRFVRDGSLDEALTWLLGARPEETPAQREKREADDEDREERLAEAQRKRRVAAREIARKVWDQGVAPDGTAVRDYLTRRGILPEHFALLPPPRGPFRFHPDLPCLASVTGKGKVEVHRGPALLAAITGPKDGFIGVQRIWLDLAQPKGKIHVVVEGEAVAAKQTLGSVRTGAIRLHTPEAAEILVMAEGIETTLSALVYTRGAPDDFWLKGAAFWAGVDLGNMSGKRAAKGVTSVLAACPNMADDHCFVPPHWVRRLVYVMDGDSEPRFTEAACKAGLRRAMKRHPGLTAQLIRAPQGKDLNDLLMAVEPVDG